MDHSLRLIPKSVRPAVTLGAWTSTAGDPRRKRRGLAKLRSEGVWRRLAGFSAVGALGVAVNTGVLALLTQDVHTWYLIASILGTEIAILSNFALTEWLVFRGAQTEKALLFRFASYVVLSNTALLISAPLLLLLVSALGMDVLVANVLSLVLLCLGRFAIADSYIWGHKLLSPGGSLSPR
jgi:putative flippase GtrA